MLGCRKLQNVTREYQQNYTNMADTCIRGRTGLKRDCFDCRDFERVYGAQAIPATVDHPVVDLRKYVNHVFKQGKLGSCSANAICATFELQLKRRAKDQGDIHFHFDSSRLYLYYNSRDYDKTTDRDEGVSLRKTLKAISVTGVCKESLWPYDVTKYAQKPLQECYDDGYGRSIYRYERLKQDIDQLRTCLKQEIPFAFGFMLYKSFCVSHDGLMPLPTEQEILSNTNPELHAVLAVGYDDRAKHFIVLNSWGTSFGENGYFYMPYEYIENPNQAFDFWKMEKFNPKIKPQVP